MNTKGGILLIEDDSTVPQVIAEVAADLELVLEHSPDGRAGLELALSNNYRLLILDLGLPGVGGIEICRRVRQQNPNVPIIILTSRADELTKVLALELGADDYIGKPFSVGELTARIKAILRRIDAYLRPPSANDPVLQVGEFSLDTNRHEVSKNGVPLTLSRTEYAVLEFLLLNANKVISRELLIKSLWEVDSPTFEATVTTYLSRLRQKIEDTPEEPRHLLTLRGVGYRFVG